MYSKRFTADDNPEETIKDHERTLEVSINCDKCGARFVEDTELKSHFHVKWESYKTILGDAINSGCHKDKIHDSISDNLETQAACLYGYCNSEQVKKCSDCVQICKYDDEYVSHIGLQDNTTCKICGNLYLNEALCNHHNEEYHGS